MGLQLVVHAYEAIVILDYYPCLGIVLTPVSHPLSFGREIAFNVT